VPAAMEADEESDRQGRMPFSLYRLPDLLSGPVFILKIFYSHFSILKNLFIPFKSL
jgi:hypothetical protein